MACIVYSSIYLTFVQSDPLKWLKYLDKYDCLLGNLQKESATKRGVGVGKGWATKKTDYFFCSQYKIKHILLKPYYNHGRLCNQVEK